MQIRKLPRMGAAAVAASCLLAVAASTASAQDAKQLYEKNCQSCHGASGKGDGPAAKVLKPPPQDFTTGLKGKSDDEIVKITKEGGKAVGKAAAMPAYGTKLNDDQIKSLVGYVKGLSK
jgi:mono/diheme cytochrome c family protein